MHRLAKHEAAIPAKHLMFDRELQHQIAALQYSPRAHETELMQNDADQPSPQA